MKPQRLSPPSPSTAPSPAEQERALYGAPSVRNLPPPPTSPLPPSVCAFSPNKTFSLCGAETNTTERFCSGAAALSASTETRSKEEERTPRSSNGAELCHGVPPSEGSTRAQLMDAWQTAAGHSSVGELCSSSRCFHCRTLPFSCVSFLLFAVSTDPKALGVLCDFFFLTSANGLPVNVFVHFP